MIPSQSYFDALVFKMKKPLKRALWPETRQFNTTLIGACMIDEYMVGVGVMGVIEHMFSRISAWIGQGIVANGWLTGESFITTCTKSSILSIAGLLRCGSRQVGEQGRPLLYRPRALDGCICLTTFTVVFSMPALVGNSERRRAYIVGHRERACSCLVSSKRFSQ